MKLGSGSAGRWAGGVEAPQPLAEETTGAGQAAAKGAPADRTGQASHLADGKRGVSAGAGLVKWQLSQKTMEGLIAQGEMNYVPQALSRKFFYEGTDLKCICFKYSFNLSCG